MAFSLMSEVNYETVQADPENLSLEPNTIKFDHNRANIALNRFLPNLITKVDLYVEPLLL